MILTGILAATAATAKWITAAKIMTAVGAGLTVAGPIIDSKIEERKRK